MEKKNIMKIAVVVLIIIALLVVTNLVKRNKINSGKDNNFKIVTSFYPMYILTQNIAQGAQDVDVVNMAEVSTGCIHNYTLMTEDLRKLENADVFVENGMGLESFTDKLTSTYSNLVIIDSSKNIDKSTLSADAHHHEGEAEDAVNPHLWLSIDNYISQVKEVTDELIRLDEKNSNVYSENSKNYIEKLENLKQQYTTELSKLDGQELISLNESFEYLGKNGKFEVHCLETDHEESTLSAEKLSEVIEEIKDEGIKAIIIDRNDSLKNANAITKETNVKLLSLDSGMSGNMDIDSYIKVMQNNLEKLKTID